MNTEERINMLNGALYACIDSEDGYFYNFGTCDEKTAEYLLLDPKIKKGVSSSGNLWFIRNRMRYVFADKNLAVIAQ